MRRLLQYVTYSRVLWLLVVGIFLNVTYIAYLVFYPYETADYNNSPFPVINSPIRAGGIVMYHLDYCRHTNRTSYFTTTLVGQTVISYPEQSSISKAGCKIINVSNVVIPYYTPPGAYHIEFNVCYHMNAIRNICKEVKTQEFNVIKE